MKKKITFTFLSILSTSVLATSEEQMIMESKQSIKLFASQLKSKLQAGMQEGGAVSAIQVCNTAADEIQKQVSKQQGWSISRTSLRLRNIKNLPDEWEEKVLNDFEKRHKLGEAVEQLEFSEVFNQVKPPVFRYMKAIPAQGLCLSCHGENLTNDIVKKLHELYPDDQATGFKQGDIRGAFSTIREIK